MSNFMAKAAHPVTGEIFECYYIDDCYGRHKYGVQFPNGDVYPESECPEHEGDSQGRRVEEAVKNVHESRTCRPPILCGSKRKPSNG